MATVRKEADLDAHAGLDKRLGSGGDGTVRDGTRQAPGGGRPVLQPAPGEQHPRGWGPSLGMPRRHDGPESVHPAGTGLSGVSSQMCCPPAVAVSPNRS